MFPRLFFCIYERNIVFWISSAAILAAASGFPQKIPAASFLSISSGFFLSILLRSLTTPVFSRLLGKKNHRPHSFYCLQKQWFLMRDQGLEPWTPWLRVRCSSNWANRAYMWFFFIFCCFLNSTKVIISDDDKKIKYFFYFFEIFLNYL